MVLSGSSQKGESIFINGTAAIILSILMLLGIALTILLSVAVIALGATFLLCGRVLTGMGAAVLGILAIVGFWPVTLNLVGFLTVGAGLVFSPFECRPHHNGGTIIITPVAAKWRSPHFFWPDAA
jgi:hypothetical protein